MSLRAHANAVMLAWKHLWFHALRSTILVLALAISLSLPLVMGSLIARGEESTTARARDTPLLVCAPGGGVDMVLGALWFLPENLGSIPFSETEAINRTGFATALPLALTARAAKMPVVGTDVEYLRFRRLQVEQGRSFTVPGECVLGARVARETGLGPGDTILTDPEGLFDIGGGYPLRLRITGTLSANDSADDGAIFCDLRTSWIIAGHGHVHKEVTEQSNPVDIMGTNDGRPVASAAVTPYTELTPELLSTLHFHDSIENLPIQAIILIPNDARSGTILSSRLDLREDLKLVSPSKVVKEVLDRVFQIGALLAGVLAATGIATIGVVLLVLVLSIRLRREELDTLRRIGASHATIATMLLAEVVMLATFACVLAFIAFLASNALPSDLVFKLAA